MTEDSPTQATPGSEVFISYASQDAAVANAIVEALERNGLRCWIAPRDVRAGAQYADAIVRAISGAKVLVLVLSANAIASSHVGKEIERASSKKRSIIALRTDAAPLTPALEYFLSESQWIEAQAGHMEAAYARLIDAIREPDRTALNIIPAVASEASARTALALHPKSRRNRILLAAGLAVVAVTIAALWAANFWPAKRVAAEQSTTASTTEVSDRSIAVLPFVDMSGKKDQEYMADGIAEELLNLLAQAPDLKVIARTSSFAFKGQNIEIAEIAKKLNVAHVLEGSVRTSGNQLRITAQLVRAADSTHLWSEKYDRSMGDVFAVQDEIAKAIVQALQIRLKGGTLNRRAGGTQNLAAYELYLRAVSAMNVGTKASLDAAQVYLEQVVKLDPDYGQAWSRMAWVTAYKIVGGYLSTQEGYERGEQYVQHALKLSPDIAEAHALLHQLYVSRDLNWAAAEVELKQALAIDPTDPFALQSASVFSSLLGHHDDAERQLRKAMLRDPLDLRLKENLAVTFYYVGRFAEAEELIRTVLDQQPDRPWTRSILARLMLAQGKPEAAFAMLQQEVDEGARISNMPIFLQAVGRQAESDAALKKQIKYWAVEYPTGIAVTYAYRGDYDHALEWLERAYQLKDSALLNIVDHPLLGKLADDPRYKAFLRNRLKLPV